jgi:subtilase family serine protease
MPFMHKAIRGYLKQQSVLTNSSEAIIAQSSVMWPAFNKSGTLMRGYPDVSALAARIPIFDTQSSPSGKIMSGGTSASTPIFAAYVVMMNDLRLQAGLPKLGNMLPLIYMLGDKHPEVFNDVTVGYHGFAQPKNGGCSNPQTGEPICDANQDCMISGMRQGLTAAPGWDAVTGFGSINFERMLRYVLPGSDAVSIASFVNNGAGLFANVSAIASATAAAAAATASSADAMKQLETFRSIAGYAALPKILS